MISTKLVFICYEQADPKFFLGTSGGLSKMLQCRLDTIGLLLCSWKWNSFLLSDCSGCIVVFNEKFGLWCQQQLQLVL